MKHNTDLISLTRTRSEEINVSLQNNSPVSRDLLQPKLQFTHFRALETNQTLTRTYITGRGFHRTVTLPNSVHSKEIGIDGFYSLSWGGSDFSLSSHLEGRGKI